MSATSWNLSTLAGLAAAAAAALLASTACDPYADWPAADETGGGTGGEPDGPVDNDKWEAYFISENIFTTGICGTPLNDATKTFHNTIKLDWSGNGIRRRPGVTQPSDLKESSFSNGEDHLLGDNFSLLVFAGHGFDDASGITFEVPDPDFPPQSNPTASCDLSFPMDTRLGTASGDRANVGIFISSCTLFNPPVNFQSFHLTPVGNSNQLVTYLGFSDSPSVQDDDLRQFWHGIKGTMEIDWDESDSDFDRWMFNMGEPGPYDNAPAIVRTAGPGEDKGDVWSLMESSNIFEGKNYTSPTGSPVNLEPKHDFDWAVEGSFNVDGTTDQGVADIFVECI